MSGWSAPVWERGPRLGLLPLQKVSALWEGTEYMSFRGEPAPADRHILVVTANGLSNTGQISFRFLWDCEYPNAENRNYNLMPPNWGMVWRSDDGGHPINVFKGSGGGLSMGGGWDKDWDRADKLSFSGEMLDAVPSCTLLMDREPFEFWTKLCEHFGVKFEHHHHNGVLSTS